MRKNVYIIAEAGVNHNGDILIAKRLIDEAKNAGADAVKFQTFKTEKIVSKKAQKADYQKNNLESNDNSQYAMIKKLELSESDHVELVSYCMQKSISFLSTPFDSDSIDFLNSIKMETFKIPSGEITNKPYLEHVGRLKKKVILSTGMSTIAEIHHAIDILTGSGTERCNIIVLHANTEYPTPMVDVNLKAMVSLGQHFGLPFGYSDHTQGIEVPIAAVALGACVIEKHFTLDRNMEGPDHKASLEPDELKLMVSSIRNIELALGDGLKKPSNSEKKNIVIARKSIHTNCAIQRGAVISKDMLIMKRPGDGISPMNIDGVIGKRAKSDIEDDYKLSWEDLE